MMTYLNPIPDVNGRTVEIVTKYGITRNKLTVTPTRVTIKFMEGIADSDQKKAVDKILKALPSVDFSIRGTFRLDDTRVKLRNGNQTQTLTIDLKDIGLEAGTL